MVNVKKGDLVRMEFTGKIASTGQIFDTTEESVAKKAGIYDKNSLYGPKLAFFGNNSIVPGIEKAIIDSQIGKKEDFLIEPEMAFGKKHPELVRMVPAKEFAKQRVSPVVGMMLTLDGNLARVKSATSGRVVVDFNHPLAGESVLYSLKVTEVIAEDKAKIEAISSSLGVAATVSKKGEIFTVAFPKSAPADKIELVKRTISAVVPGTEFVS